MLELAEALADLANLALRQGQGTAQCHFAQRVDADLDNLPAVRLVDEGLDDMCHDGLQLVRGDEGVAALRQKGQKLRDLALLGAQEAQQVAVEVHEQQLVAAARRQQAKPQGGGGGGAARPNYGGAAASLKKGKKSARKATSMRAEPNMV